MLGVEALGLPHPSPAPFPGGFPGRCPWSTLDRGVCGAGPWGVELGRGVGPEGSGVSLVFLQLLKVSEQRFVELRIMLFDFRRENDRLNLHLRRHHVQYLHKRRNALR